MLRKHCKRDVTRREAHAALQLGRDILILPLLALRCATQQDVSVNSDGLHGLRWGVRMRGLYTCHRSAKQTVPFPYLRPHFAGVRVQDRRSVLPKAASDDQRSGLDRSMQQSSTGANPLQASGPQRVRTNRCMKASRSLLSAVPIDMQ